MIQRRIRQGNPFYFIETLERRSINSKGNMRGIIPTLLILSFKPPNIKDLVMCAYCGLYISKEHLNKPINRYRKGKPYCLSCLLWRKKMTEEKQRYKFYDKDFKEVPAETEDKWKKIAYAIDYEKKEVELTNYPVSVGNGEEIELSIFVNFEQIKGLSKKISEVKK